MSENKFVVIKCNNCNVLTYKTKKQKTFSCKICGRKNNFTELKEFMKARDCSLYIREENAKMFCTEPEFKQLKWKE